jgi:RNA polymerase sigma factor (sigma-70 family)
MQKDIRELGLPLYYVLGNHDSNYFRNNPERFSEKEMRELYLPERERMVILLRFYKNLTQDRVSKVLGVSQVQVSRIERRAVAHLREALTE